MAQERREEEAAEADETHNTETKAFGPQPQFVDTQSLFLFLYVSLMFFPKCWDPRFLETRRWLLAHGPSTGWKDYAESEHHHLSLRGG